MDNMDNKFRWLVKQVMEPDTIYFASTPIPTIRVLQYRNYPDELEWHDVPEEYA